MEIKTIYGPPERTMGFNTAIVISFSYFLVFVSQNLWRATFHNYAIDIYGITPVQMGMAFSLISLPGLFSVLIGFLGGKVRLVVLLFFSSCFMGAGFIIYGTGRVWPQILGGIVILHLGFAIFYLTANVILLSVTIPNQAVKKLSLMRSLGPLSGIAVAAFMLFALTPFGYSTILVTLGCLVLLTGVAAYAFTPLGQRYLPQNHISLDRKLGPYYALNFLNGCRSGLFKTFVLYYLVSEFGFQLKFTAAIVLLGNLMTFMGYQICGRLAARHNPARILSFIYLILVVNFLGFYYFKTPEILSVLYLTDSLVFCTPAIIDAYLKFISKDRDLLGNLSAGLTLFHLGGVVIPPLGGLLYARNNTGIFFFGSLFALISLWISLSSMPEIFKRNGSKPG
ncbi:MAG: MFS transporter [Desulfobacteraceae bacterium]|nr:MFS transporter [Desulfobacteraceae bacterium]